jgi:hypothetical protein
LTTDRGVEDERLEYSINNWLAEHGKYNKFAGAIVHPATGRSNEEDGILIMTKFLETSRDDNPVVQEQKRDIRVKNWLLNEGGAQPDEIEWMSLWDNFYLTRNGICPERNDVRGPWT